MSKLPRHPHDSSPWQLALFTLQPRFKNRAPHPAWRLLPADVTNYNEPWVPTLGAPEFSSAGNEPAKEHEPSPYRHTATYNLSRTWSTLKNQPSLTAGFFFCLYIDVYKPRLVHSFWSFVHWIAGFMHWPIDLVHRLGSGWRSCIEPRFSCIGSLVSCIGQLIWCIDSDQAGVHALSTNFRALNQGFRALDH